MKILIFLPTNRFISKAFTYHYSQIMRRAYKKLPETQRTNQAQQNTSCSKIYGLIKSNGTHHVPNKRKERYLPWDNRDVPSSAARSRMRLSVVQRYISLRIISNLTIVRSKYFGDVLIRVTNAFGTAERSWHIEKGKITMN